MIRRVRRQSVAALCTAATALAAVTAAGPSGWLLPPTWPVRLVAATGAGVTVAAVAAVPLVALNLMRRARRRERLGQGRGLGASATVLGRILVAALALSCAVGPSPWPTTGTGAGAAPGLEEVAFAAAPLGAPGAVRVYVGLQIGSTTAERIDHAIEAWVAGGGLDRGSVLIAVPTGSGWVDPQAVAAAEVAAGGNITTLVLPYAQRPSWVEALVGGPRAQEVTVALVEAVHAVLQRAPVEHRPRLVIFGESLGATAALAAAARVPVDACLAAGTPVFRRDAARTAFGARTATGTDGGACVRVSNADDPVARWSASLLLRPPPGPQRSPGGHLHWIPVVTFWQASAEMLISLDQPAGHGHHYGASLAPHWRDLLHGPVAAQSAGTADGAGRAAGLISAAGVDGIGTGRGSRAGPA